MSDTSETTAAAEEPKETMDETLARHEHWLEHLFMRLGANKPALLPKETDTAAPEAIQVGHSAQG